LNSDLSRELDICFEDFIKSRGSADINYVRDEFLTSQPLSQQTSIPLLDVHQRIITNNNVLQGMLQFLPEQHLSINTTLSLQRNLNHYCLEKANSFNE